MTNAAAVTITRNTEEQKKEAEEHEHHHHDDACGCGHEHHHHHHADEVFTSWGQETVKTFTKEQIEGILKKLSEDTAYVWFFVPKVW